MTDEPDATARVPRAVAGRSAGGRRRHAAAATRLVVGGVALAATFDLAAVMAAESASTTRCTTGRADDHPHGTGDHGSGPRAAHGRGRRPPTRGHRRRIQRRLADRLAVDPLLLAEDLLAGGGRPGTCPGACPRSGHHHQGFVVRRGRRGARPRVVSTSVRWARTCTCSCSTARMPTCTGRMPRSTASRTSGAGSVTGRRSAGSTDTLAAGSRSRPRPLSCCGPPSTHGRSASGAFDPLLGVADHHARLRPVVRTGRSERCRLDLSAADPWSTPARRPRGGRGASMCAPCPWPRPRPRGHRQGMDRRPARRRAAHPGRRRRLREPRRRRVRRRARPA